MTKKEKRIPRIAIVSNSTCYTFYFRLGLLKRLRDLGFEAVVISPKDHFSSKVMAEGFQFVPLPVNLYNINPANEFKLVFTLISIYKKLDLDFILHYTAKPNVYGTFAAYFCGIPSIAITTGLGILRSSNEKLSKFFLFAMYRLVGKMAKEVWFLNNDDRAIFLKKRIVKPENTFLLPSEGVDISWYKPYSLKKKEPSVIRFLYAGRVVWSKGMKELYEAASIIRAKRKDVVFEILGFLVPEHPDGVPINLVQQWQDSGVIRYLGETEDVRPFIEVADCIILPSFYEGVSRILLEGASMAKPIIATDVVGCREVVDNGVNGLLCQPKNVKDLVEKIEFFLDMSHQDRVKMGLKGRKKVIQNFEENHIIDHYIEALRKYFKMPVQQHQTSSIQIQG